MHGYCSDITRMFVVGDVDPEVRDAYDVLVAAQEAGVQAATVGTPCEEVDAATRAVIADAGYGEYFVHRTGHGIGTEAHEDPYVVAGNAHAARAGPRVQRGAGDLPPRSLRAAARGHRGRHRRGARAAEPRGTRSRDRRLTDAVRPRDPARAVGRRRPPLLLGHHPSTRAGHRVRLAAAHLLRRDGDPLGRVRRRRRRHRRAGPQRVHRAHGAGRGRRLRSSRTCDARPACRGSARRASAAPRGSRR